MTASQATVLVVDDEAALADSYAEWLDAEYDVRTAYSGEGALAALDESVDVVVLDERLPDLSGEAVLDVVEDRGLDCRVALVSAVASDRDAFDLGVERSVTDAETLRSAVETLCRRDDYDDKMRRYFALASERGALEAAKSRGELDGDEAYRELLDELDALRGEVEATMDRLDNDDYRADFRDRREAWQTRSDGASDGANAGSATGAGTSTETPAEASNADSPGGPDAGTGAGAETRSAEPSGRKPETERE